MNSKKIQLGDHNFLVIDLTIPLRLDQAVYPGDSPPRRTLISDIESDGWRHYTHELSDHCFHPHGDAPNHFSQDPQAKGFESFSLDWVFHQACMIDLSESDEAQNHNGITFLTEVRREHLEPFSDIIGKMGAIIIRTGYDKWVEKNIPNDPDLLPYLTGDAAEFIASKEHLRIVGIDSLTVDAYGLQVSHQALKNSLIVESLVHLYEIPEATRMHFTLQISPVRIVGATGGPIVAYAFIPIFS